MKGTEDLPYSWSACIKEREQAMADKVKSQGEQSTR